MGKNAKRLIVITGCDTGIGRSLSEILIKQGYALAISYLKENPFKDYPEVYAKKMDLRIPEEVNEFCAFVKRMCRDKKIYALINNAGMAVGGTVENTPLTLYREVFEVNFFGVAAVTQALIPEIIRNKGKILVIGSFAGRIAMPFFSAYASSKFALEGFCDSLRREMNPFGVKTVLIEPAAVATPIWNNGKKQDISFIGEKYRECFLNARDSFIKGGNAGMTAYEAASIISDILFKKNPCSRYLISESMLKTKLLARLPNAVLDKAIKKIYKMDYGKKHR